MNKDLNTPVWQLTVGELLDFMIESVKPAETKTTFEHKDRYVYGIQGIANLLGVSKIMVWKYRKHGWIEPAIRQVGRKIVRRADGYGVVWEKKEVGGYRDRKLC